MLKSPAPFPQPGASALLTRDGETIPVRIIQKNANGTLFVLGERILDDDRRTVQPVQANCWPWDLVPTPDSARGMKTRDLLRTTPPGDVAAAIFAALSIGTLLFATHIVDPLLRTYPAPDRIEVMP